MILGIFAFVRLGPVDDIAILSKKPDFGIASYRKSVFLGPGGSKIPKNPEKSRKKPPEIVGFRPKY